MEITQRKNAFQTTKSYLREFPEPVFGGAQNVEPSLHAIDSVVVPDDSADSAGPQSEAPRAGDSISPHTVYSDRLGAFDAASVHGASALLTALAEERSTSAGNTQDGVPAYAIPIASTSYADEQLGDPRLKDRIWRLNNLYSVIDEDGVLKKFQLRPAQIYLLEHMHYKNIILKARQLGFTTFICIFLLDYALFNTNKMVGIIAHTQLDATTIFRKVKIAWDNLSTELKEHLKLVAVGDSKSEYEFSNGSVMRISTSLRSGTYQAVLITEFGKICARFPEKAEEIVTGTLPAVPSNGLVFIESTAEGETGRYYDMVQEAMKAMIAKRILSMKEYKFFFFPWYQNPADVVPGDIPIDPKVNEYLDKMELMLKIQFTQVQRNWYFLEQKIQKDKMKQEHPSTPEEAFLVSGNKLFNGEAVDRQRLLYMAAPIESGTDGFRIFVKYNKAHIYVCAADVSMGVLKDSSTIVILDCTTNQVVMTFKSDSIDPITFAHEIKKAALMYGGCLAAPEANNVGLTTVVELSRIYPNVYVQQRVGLLEEHATQKLGWLTTSGTKPKMMYELSEAMSDDDIHVLDEEILLEARQYNKEDSLTTDAASTTRHFDLLTACAIAWQVRIYATKGLMDQEAVQHVEATREENLTRTKSKYR